MDYGQFADTALRRSLTRRFADMAVRRHGASSTRRFADKDEGMPDDWATRLIRHKTIGRHSYIIISKSWNLIISALLKHSPQQQQHVDDAQSPMPVQPAVQQRTIRTRHRGRSPQQQPGPSAQQSFSVDVSIAYHQAVQEDSID